MTENEIQKIRETIRPAQKFEPEEKLFNRLRRDKKGGPWYEQYSSIERRSNKAKAQQAKTDV